MSRQLSAKLTKENSKFVAFSPISIATTLAQLQFGASGTTEQELMDFTGIENHEQFGNLLQELRDNNNENQQINLANGIFLDKNNGITLRENYKTSIETIYQSQIVTLDFANERTASRKYINDWIKIKTNGKIEKILTGGFGNNHYSDDGILASGDDHSSNGMLIANAVYFKAFWQKAFLNGVTTKRMFYPNGKKDGAKGKFMVDMMATVGQFQFYNSKEYGKFHLEFLLFSNSNSEQTYVTYFSISCFI